MEFEYSSTIYIRPSDLHEMFERVKNGEDFDIVYDYIMAGYDDRDYYNCDFIQEDVRTEIERRIEQAKGEK